MRSRVLLFCLLSPVLCHAGGKPLVRLCERTTVTAKTVRLSDFFPPEVTAIREEAAAIELGRSPLLGSSRHFIRQEIEDALRDHPGLSKQLFIPDSITAFRAGWPISTDVVQSAIFRYTTSRDSNSGGLSFGPLTLLGNPVANQPVPDLKIVKVERDIFHGEVRFTVRCVQRNECGMFLATVRQTQTFSSQLLSGRQALAGISPMTFKPLLVRAGAPAMLNLRNDAMNISLRVICLDRGSLGQIIRVRDAAGQKIFRAKVVGAAEVQASL